MREQAIAMKAGRIVNIKLGRVGGFGEAKRVHDVVRGGGDSGVVRRDAGGRDRARAQYRAGDAAEFHAAGRCVGEQPLLEARHYFACGGDHAARDDCGSRRAGVRL